jgi:hypothetical protein
MTQQMQTVGAGLRAIGRCALVGTGVCGFGEGPFRICGSTLRTSV